MKNSEKLSKFFEKEQKPTKIEPSGELISAEVYEQILGYMRNYDLFPIRRIKAVEE